MNSANFIEKIIEFKSGALVAIATPTSFGISFVIKELFKGLDLKDLLMPLVVVFFTLFIFAGLFIQDFVLGLKASKVKNLKVTSHRRWQSFYKFFTVAILMFCMTVFDFLFLLVGLITFYNLFLWLMILIMVMVCLYEFHSIGKNIEIIYGKKPKLFGLLDKLAERTENGIIKRFEKYLL